MRAAWTLVVAFGPAAAAQPVFFDDFEGNALLPHWSTPPPSHWQYDVSNSMLNVTALLWPSHPKSPSNWAIMGTTYAPQTDFRADIWMGWEPGDRPHRLGFHVLGPQGQGMASFGFRNESAFGPGPQIFAGASGLGSSSPAPAAGIHQFTITRTGTQFEFYLNGGFFASFHDLFGTPAWGISLEFLGPYPGQFGAFHVDRVAMVPSPGAMMISFALALWSAERGRR